MELSKEQGSWARLPPAPQASGSLAQTLGEGTGGFPAVLKELPSEDPVSGPVALLSPFPGTPRVCWALILQLGLCWLDLTGQTGMLAAHGGSPCTGFEPWLPLEMLVALPVPGTEAARGG